MEQQKMRRPSPAKAAIAQVKPRDEYGHFVTREEKEVSQARLQQAQFQAERDRMNAILGRNSNGGQQLAMQQQMPIEQIQPNNFQTILQANKPGTTEDVNRWNKLLGKDKTSNNRRMKNFRRW